ncbi:ABC transporter ATP-binding protein [Aminobacter aganoensis]|uniref:Oligopeptide/dipeptide ABC transporter ATP-binding protein n=1 Tax=Aminobacter aganoensis TaxID=83264 RepID=A0A7X0FD44_9HYPH|nr:oligopeptide/dipeptide ABC transporter ATP-binding protein [Aminobacter aganoensis]
MGQVFETHNVAAHDQVLKAVDLSVSFQSGNSNAVAVDHVSFGVARGEMLALVGESGCGKSTAALALLGLLRSPPARVEGRILLAGRSILGLPPADLQQIRGKSIAMIFQQPMTSLNPVLTIERQLTESTMAHESITRSEAISRARDALELVGISSPETRLRQYPHQLSGGMRQRVMIAMAMACRPSVLVADEPTTALDVTMQAQILSLIKGLKRDFGVATILITHDLGVVAENADRVAVMYAGRIVEQAGTSELFRAPAHPYTRGLIAAVPRLDGVPIGSAQTRRLQEIPGSVPQAGPSVPGCPFAPRCPLASDRCRSMRPMEVAIAPEHLVSCWEYAA